MGNVRNRPEKDLPGLPGEVLVVATIAVPVPSGWSDSRVVLTHWENAAFARRTPTSAVPVMETKGENAAEPAVAV